MPTFQAKTKDEIKAERSERYEPPPQPEREPLPKISDGTAVNHYYFRSRTDTVEAVTTPGFFDFMRDTFRSGGQKGVIHMVTVHLGEAADGLTEVDLHLVSAPTQFSGPVLMAAGEIKRFRPVTGGKTKAA